MYNLSEKPWQKYPIKNHLTPKDGYICMCNLYWIVTEDNCLLKYGKGSYQCNSKEKLAAHGIEYYPNCSVKYFDVLYFPHDCQEYV